MNKTNRTNSLLPNGIPKYVRAYDNGGTDSGGSIDRYTVCFTGRYKTTLERKGQRTIQSKLYLAMNCAPFHPQGFGQHGVADRQIDVNKHGYAPAIGRKCHLGKRIPFTELPKDCQSLVLSDYREIWGLE